MKKLLLLMAFALVFAFIPGCSSKDDFSVTAQVDGLGSEGLTMIYFDGHALQQIEIRSDEQGRFAAKGVSEQPAFVEILRADGSPLISFIAANGDKVKIAMDLDVPEGAKISGTKANEALTAFAYDNSAILDNPAALNAKVAEYVAQHPGDVATTLILMKYFTIGDDIAAVDSLFNSIEPAARPMTLVESYSATLSALDAEASRRHLLPLAFTGLRDSMLTYVATAQPYSLLLFADNRLPDSVRSTLVELCREMPRKRLRIIQVTLWGDSAEWNNSARRDTVDWERAWVPGGAANPSLRTLAIPRTPFFIVADSTGTQRYRGSSVKKVLSNLLTR